MDECGILHKTFVSPLIAAPGEVAFAVVSLYKDRLEIAAHGIEKTSHIVKL